MLKILIVDDQKEVRELIAVTLRGDKYVLLQAWSGQQAVDMAKAELPDLVIMDIMMPGDIDGLQATRILKDDPETKGCTIIMLTAKGQKVDIEKGRDAGADGYFIKPFSPLELIKKVEEVLG